MTDKDLNEVLAKCDRKGAESLTEDEIDLILDSARGMTEAMEPLAKAYAELVRGYMDAFGPLMKFAREIENEQLEE